MVFLLIVRPFFLARVSRDLLVDQCCLRPYHFYYKTLVIHKYRYTIISLVVLSCGLENPIMAMEIKVIDSGVIGTYGDHEAFSLDVLAGLSETRKSLPSRYMYNDRGSELFNRIMQLPEYYPTNCEMELLKLHRDHIARYLGDEPFNLVEFGPGNGAKTRILIEHFLNMSIEFQYVPIDISRSALESLIKDWQPSFPDLEINALVADYFSGMKWLTNHNQRRNLILFMGSNIGNFSHKRARFFLRNLWNGLNNDDSVMIGFDLKKDIELLLSAYNDPSGVTSEFNLNILSRINSELGGQFDLSKFRHFGTYDVFSGAMESYLVSREQQEVFIEEIGRSFSFGPWEPIHVEYSYKYLESDIDALAYETGFEVQEHLYDSRRFFIDSIWRVKKSNGN